MELKTELENSGATVEMYSLENNSLKEEGFVTGKIEKADHVIIGFPVYGSDLPGNMRDFVENLPLVSGRKKFSVLCTQAAFSGDANVYFQKTVEEKGYEFSQSFQINFTTNFNVAMLPFSFSKPASGKKLEKKKNKVIKKIKEMSRRITSDERYIEGKRFYQILLGKLQRTMFRRSEKKLPENFKFFKDRCVKCKICVNNCPTGCLTLEEEPELNLSRKGNCFLCFRCYNFCPENAINFGKRIGNPDKYIRYKGPVDNLKISDIKK